jgi:hypothetical protein
MPLLIEANKSGYKQLISDRAKIFKRILTLEEEITNLKRILEEQNEAVVLMKSLFYPKVEIIVDPDNPNIYSGYLLIKFPKSNNYKFELGNVTDYNSPDDPELKVLSSSKAKEILETEFPEYFI